MSKKALVSVYDKVAGLYSPVMTEVNIDSAIRNFKLGAKQNQQISACPQDYELHLISLMDDETGLVFPSSEEQSGPICLFKAIDLFSAE